MFHHVDDDDECSKEKKNSHLRVLWKHKKPEKSEKFIQMLFFFFFPIFSIYFRYENEITNKTFPEYFFFLLFFWYLNSFCLLPFFCCQNSKWEKTKLDSSKGRKSFSFKFAKKYNCLRRKTAEVSKATAMPQAFSWFQSFSIRAKRHDDLWKNGETEKTESWRKKVAEHLFFIKKSHVSIQKQTPHPECHL